MEQLQQQIDELKKELETLKNARDLNHNKLMYTEIIKELPYDGFVQADTVTTYGADLQRTITINSTPDSFTVPENPTKSAIIRASDDNLYRILLYSLT